MKARRKTGELNQFVGFILVVCLAFLSTGCETMTGRLWDAEAVNRCMPASKPNTQLYWIAARQDVLVTYDELREKNDSIRRRAFFFKPNLRRLEDRNRPVFIDPAKMVELRLEPIFEPGSTNATPQSALWVRISDDGHEFTLFWAGTDLGPYALPVYVDRDSKTKRFLLTPVTAAGDFIVVVVIVAVAVGAVAAYSYAASSH